MHHSTVSATTSSVVYVLLWTWAVEAHVYAPLSMARNVCVATASSFQVGVVSLLKNHSVPPAYLKISEISVKVGVRVGRPVVKVTTSSSFGYPMPYFSI